MHDREMVVEQAHRRFSDITFLTHLGRTPGDAAIALSATSGGHGEPGRGQAP